MDKILKTTAFFLAGSVVGLFAFMWLSGFFSKKQDVLGETNSGINRGQEVIPSETPTSAQMPLPTLTPIPTFTPAPTLSPDPTLSPTSISTPTPIVAPDNLLHWFRQYAGHYGIDEQLLIRIAWCESRFDPGAVNGPYLGLYQFMEERWITYRTQMGHDINSDLRANPEEAIKTAAYIISVGKLFMWPNCSR